MVATYAPKRESVLNRRISPFSLITCKAIPETNRDGGQPDRMRTAYQRLGRGDARPLPRQREGQPRSLPPPHPSPPHLPPADGWRWEKYPLSKIIPAKQNGITHYHVLYRKAACLRIRGQCSSTTPHPPRIRTFWIDTPPY